MSTTTSPPAAEFDPEVSPTPTPTGATAPGRPRVRRVIVGLPPAEPAVPAAEPDPGPPRVRRVIVGAPPLPAPEANVPAAPVAVAAIPAPAPIAASRDLGQQLRRIGTQRGIVLGALAVIVAGLGEALLFQEPSRNAGAVLIGLGMVLGAVAWHGLPEAPLLTRRAAGLRDLVRWRRGLALRLAGIGGALALTGGSILAWWAAPDAIFGWQGVLWLAGMGLLLLACARWYPQPARETDLGPPWTRREALLFGGILALALCTHLAWLDAIPWRFHFDEGIAFTETMRFYRGPQIPLFTTTWWGTSLPSLWFPFAAGLLHLTGVGLTGVRLGVALVGALTVIPVYGLARLAWGRIAAALAAGLVAISAVYIHYSRVSILNITTAFAWAVCFYFLLRGLRSRRPGDFAWAGLAAGLSMYTYYGTRLLPYLLLIFGAYLAICHFRATRERLGHLALVPVGFVAGFGPLIAYFQTHPEMWSSRGLAMLNIPPGIPTTWDGWVRDWNILLPLAVRNFLGLSVIPGKDTVYFAPFFQPLEAVVLLVGAGVLIARWRQPAAFLVLLWGLSVTLTSTLIDRSTIPNFAHWAPAFPAFFLALALPLALWLRAMRQAGRRTRQLGTAIMAGALIWAAGANAYAYLVQYPPLVPLENMMETVQGRMIAAAGPRARVRIVGDTWQGVRPDIAEMMNPQTRSTSFFNPSRELPVLGDPTHDLFFVFYNDEVQYLPAVQAVYPGGQTQEVRAHGGVFVADTYFVPAAQAMARYGVIATVSAGDKVVWQGQVSQVGSLPAQVALPYPVTATWSGAFFKSGTETVQLSVLGMLNTQVWVLGAPAGQNAPLTLDSGWVPFSVRARFDGPARPRLLLQVGQRPGVEIDTAHLWPQAANQGLAVTFNGATITHRIDPFVGADIMGTSVSHVATGVPAPIADVDPEIQTLAPLSGGGNLIRWEGEVRTDEGNYLMELHTDGHTLMLLDGKQVLTICNNVPGDHVIAQAMLPLSAGWHQVRIDFQATGSVNGLFWTWLRPDKVREVVPPDRLRFRADPAPDAPIPWPAAPVPVPCAP